VKKGLDVVGLRVVERDRNPHDKRKILAHLIVHAAQAMIQRLDAVVHGLYASGLFRCLKRGNPAGFSFIPVLVGFPQQTSFTATLRNERFMPLSS
jgi:hypothetical protein